MSERGWSTGQIVLLALLLSAILPPAAIAIDLDAEFAKGTLIAGAQIGGGAQNNVERHGFLSGISFLDFTPRLSYLPLPPFGSSWLKGAIEPGLEGWAQYYFGPDTAYALGLKVALRYHFLGLHLGPVVPYIEGTAGAGGTNLDVREIRSDFTFVLEAGAGLSYFVTPGVAINLGYRFQHVSNGNVSKPNRGLNSDSGVLGVSFFFH